MLTRTGTGPLPRPASKKFGDSILIFIFPLVCKWQGLKISMLSPNFLLAGRGSGPAPTELEML